MAEEIIFKTSVDTGNSVKNVNEVDRSLKETGKTTQELKRAILDAEKQVDKMSKTYGENAKQTDEARKSLAALNIEYARNNKQSVGLEERLKQMNKTVAETPINVRRMNKQIQEYQAIALEAGRTSPIGKEALAQAAQLKDRYTDIQNEVKRLSDDQKNLKGVMEISSGVVAGYGAVKSAMSLTGIESESLQKSMVKLQAAQTLLNSLDRIRTSLQKESSAMLLLNTVATKSAAAAQVVYTIAVGATTGAMKALRIAMLAIPLVAIIAGIVALVATINELVTATEDLTKINDELSTSFDRIQKSQDRASKNILKNMDNQIATAKANGASQQELHALEMERLAKEEAARKRQGMVYAYELNERQKVYKKALRDEDYELAKSISDQIEATREKYKDIRDLDGQYAIDKKNREAEFKKQEEEKAKQEREKNAQAWKSAQDKRKQEEEKAAKEKLERERLIGDLMIANIEDEQLRSRATLENGHKREREDLIAKYGQDTELLLQLEAKQAGEIEAFNKGIREKSQADQEAMDALFADSKAKRLEQEHRDEKAALEIKLIQMADDFNATQELQRELNAIKLEEDLANTDLTENEKLLIKERYAAKEAELDEADKARKIQIANDIKDASISIAETSLSALQGISDVLFEDQLNKAEKGSAAELKIKKKQFEINKKLQIAQAIMQGVQAVQAAYSSGSAIPVVGAVTGPLFAVLAGVASVLNINKIKKQKFDSGGGVGLGTQPRVSMPSIPSASDIINSQNEGTETAGLTGSGSTNQNVITEKPTQKIVLVDSDLKAGLQNYDKAQVTSSFG